MSVTSKLVTMGAAGSGGEAYWISTLGGAGSDFGRSVTTDSSGNIYVAGSTNSTGAGNSDLLLAKYDTSGSVVWQRTLGGARQDDGYSVATDFSGNIYVAGSTDSTSVDLLLAKYDSTGSLVWQRTLVGGASEYGYSVATDSSGNIYVAGSTISTGAGNYDLLLARYNSTGSLVWQRTLGGGSADFGRSVTTDSSGNIYVAGNSYVTSGTRDELLLAKYNSTGSIVWQRTLGGAKQEYGYSVATDSSGNIYVAGSTESTSVDLLLAKYDSTGSLVWQRTLGGGSSEFGYSVATDSSGNIYIFGSTDSTGAGGYDFLLAKLPPDGSLTGTHGVFTYAESTLTAATSSLTSATSSLTASTSSLTAATSSLTAATSSLSSTLTEM